MKKRALYFMLALPVICALSRIANAQVYINMSIQQPPVLISDAGANQNIPPGGSTSIGGITTGGTTPYYYAWSPAEGLSGTAVANPVASPSVTTTYYLTVNDANGCNSTDSVIVYVGNMGIGNSSGTNLFSIVPNPGTGLFSITLPDVPGNRPTSLELYDPLGKRVYSVSFTDDLIQTAVPLELSNMPKGAYLVKVTLRSGADYSKTLILD